MLTFPTIHDHQVVQTAGGEQSASLRPFGGRCFPLSWLPEAFTRTPPPTPSPPPTPCWAWLTWKNSRDLVLLTRLPWFCRLRKFSGPISIWCLILTSLTVQREFPAWSQLWAEERSGENKARPPPSHAGAGAAGASGLGPGVCKHHFHFEYSGHTLSCLVVW